MWHTMAINKTFLRDMNGGLSIPEIWIYPCKDKAMPSLSRECSNITSMPPDSWLVFPCKWYPIRSSALVYGCWRFGQSGMAVANWGEDHKSEPMHSFHLCHPRYFVLGLIGIEVGGWGKRSGIQGRDILFISAVEVLWWALCRTWFSSHDLPILKKPSIHLSLSQPYHQFFNFVKSLTSQPAL